MIQKKALIFAKKIIVENVQESYAWLQRWKEKSHITFKILSGNRKLLQQKWLMKEGVVGNVSPNVFYQTANLNIFTTNLDYFMNDFQIKPINISLKSALMESSVKYESQAWQ